MLQGLCFGEEAGARNVVFFRVKWLQATMKGTSSVRRVRLRSVCFFFCRIVTVASSCFGCACVCVVIGCCGICACRSHWNGCMMLQGLCFREEAGARNLVFFRVKWLQPAMKGTSSVRRVRLRSVCLFFCRIVTVASSCFGCACVCVVIGCFGICACRSHWNGCMMLQGLCFGEEAGARNRVFFRVKWLQPARKGTSSVRRVRLRSVCLFFLPQCNGGFKLLWVCLCARSNRVFWNLCLQIALEWLHDVARALFWGGSRSTKPCVFPCKVAAAGDERYLVCAAGAAAVGLPFFFCRIVTVASSCFGCACVCVVIGCFGICACRSHWNGCMMLQGLCFGEEAGARNLVFFRVKWLQPARKGTSSAGRVRLRSVCLFFFCRSVTVASSCFGCACVCVVIGCFGICACRSHWNGCMMLQGLCFGEEAGARNLVFFRVKWLQPAMKGTSSVRRVRLRSVCLFFLLHCNGGFKLLWVCLCVCVVIGCFGIRACRSHWNGCMMLQGLCFGEEAGARNVVFFRVKWLQATMKGTSSVRRLRLRSFHARIVPPMCFATSGCVCVRSSMRFLKLWWQIAL